MNNQELVKLLDDMTLNEKIGEMIQVTPELLNNSLVGNHTGPLFEMGITTEDVPNIGSVLATNSYEEVVSLQKRHMELSRTKVPLIFMADIIHGYKTIYPVPLGLGAMWNPQMVTKLSEMAAMEASNDGIQVTFSPMVDLVRDARWGRVMESTGEDPYLNSQYGTAFVRGYQGDSEKIDNTHIAACIKHFAAYGAVEGGREYSSVDVSERVLHEYYLPSYQAAVKAGAKLVMTAFTNIDSIPATANQYLMQDILRDKMGFEGVLVSDWGAVKEIIAHGVAEGPKDAAVLSIKAGVDIEMMSNCYYQSINAIIEDNPTILELIDQAVLRVLKLKRDLGLFDDPYRRFIPTVVDQEIKSKHFRRLAQQAAEESFVLLKNQNKSLPLTAQTNIGLIGPYADTQDILGNWSCLGDTKDVTTIKVALDGKVDKLNYAGAKSVDSFSECEIAQMNTVIQESDVLILALGESSDASGEARSKGNIRLAACQERLVHSAKQEGKQVIVVLFNGRPLNLEPIIADCDALLTVWLPGIEGGNAIANVLMGDINPSGKLSMSFPKANEQLPIYYNQVKAGRPFKAEEDTNLYVSRYIDIPNRPLFPFGFGLSYTNFEYSELAVNHAEFTINSGVDVSIKLTNTGDVDGQEVVQLYVEDVIAQVSRPVKELRSFKKVKLHAGEIKQVKFHLDAQAFSYFHSDLTFKADMGQFRIYVGNSSETKTAINIKLVDDRG